MKWITMLFIPALASAKITSLTIERSLHPFGGSQALTAICHQDFCEITFTRNGVFLSKKIVESPELAKFADKVLSEVKGVESAPLSPNGWLTVRSGDKSINLTVHLPSTDPPAHYVILFRKVEAFLMRY